MDVAVTPIGIEIGHFGPLQVLIQDEGGPLEPGAGSKSVIGGASGGTRGFRGWITKNQRDAPGISFDPVACRKKECVACISISFQIGFSYSLLKAGNGFKLWWPRGAKNSQHRGFFIAP
jgi:hypothetical protein